MAISKGDFEGANLVGGPFKDYVNDQVKVRQDILGKLDKDSSDIVWENGKSAFIALGSSVNIENALIPIESPTTQDVTGNGGNTQATTDLYGYAGMPSQKEMDAIFADSPVVNNFTYVENQDGYERIKALDLGGEPDTYLGNYLAKNIVLFGGTSYYPEASSGGLGSINMRSGLSNQNNILNDSAYGFGGNEQGFSAMPGVTSFDIKSRNMGSLREAAVSIRANNEQQFKMIDNLYCRIGYTMFLEWGNTSYYNNKKEYESGTLSTSLMDTFLQGYYLGEKGEKISLFSQPTKFVGKIEQIKKSTNGNYDGFFGRVKNFSWTFHKDGYYEITLSLISWGDVVESLTIDGLYGSKTSIANLDFLPQPNSVSSLTTFLTIASEPPTEYINGNTTDYTEGQAFKTKLVSSWESTLIGETRYTRKEKDTAPSISYTRLTSSANKIISAHAVFGKNHYFYVRLGDILDFIKDRLLVYLEGGEAIVDIDTDTNKNICYHTGVNMSADPSKVMVRASIPVSKEDLKGLKNPPEAPYTKKQQDPDWIHKINQGSVFSLSQVKLEPFTSRFNPNTKAPGFPLHGKIMNIYFEYQYLLDTIQNLRDENTTTIPLYDFINKLLETANSCLGGVNKLSIRLEENRILRIYDQIQIPGTQYNEGNTINLYGITPQSGSIANQGSFVTDFNIKTELTNEFSTTVAIGAQAQGGTVGEDATGLSAWNYGLVDRYYPKKVDSLKKNNNAKTLTPEERLENITQKLKYLWLGYAQGYYRTKDNLQEGDPRIELELEERSYWFGYENVLVANFYSFPDFPVRRYSDFVKLQKDFLEQLILINNLKENSIRTLNGDQGIATNQIGMIPINISVTMDGISGIRIYDRLKIDTRFLPNYYPQTLIWVIKGVSHEIQNNKWYTKLETIAVPKITESESLRSFIGRGREISNIEAIKEGKQVEFVGATPNANRLRTVLTSLGYTEKKIEKVNGELSSGGDLASQTTNVAIKLFELIKEKYPSIQIEVTGGNDLTHQNFTSNSYHKKGFGIDFKINPNSMIQILQIQDILMSVRLGTPGFRFLNEYTNPSKDSTGDHFHFTLVPGRKAENANQTTNTSRKQTSIDLS